MDVKILESTIKAMVVSGKGILAADESNGTIKKRFDTIQVESTEETRRDYRDLLFTAPHLSDHICGVIMYDETLRQNRIDGTPFPTVLEKQGIVPGIKVDKGLVPLANSLNEKTTQGLDGLPERLDEYFKLGARFAKWRVVYQVNNDELPSCLIVKTNAEMLARYAAICQNANIVPIVEPEVLIDGTHDIERCEFITRIVLHNVFEALYRHEVKLEYIILKPSMVTSGKEAPKQASVEEVAKRTIKLFKETVPAVVPSINFLSGGQSDELATAHLNAMNKLGPLPWYVSFSYGRALQAPALAAWLGKTENVEIAQDALIKRAKLNGLAAQGKYESSME